MSAVPGCQAPGSALIQAGGPEHETKMGTGSRLWGVVCCKSFIICGTWPGQQGPKRSKHPRYRKQKGMINMDP